MITNDGDDDGDDDINHDNDNDDVASAPALRTCRVCPKHRVPSGSS